MLAAPAARALGPGDLDPTFNGGTPVLIDAAQGSRPVTGVGGVAVEADGSVMVAGGTRDAQDRGATYLARLTTDGMLDPAFATGGVPVTQVGLGARPSCSAQRTDLSRREEAVARSLRALRASLSR